MNLEIIDRYRCLLLGKAPRGTTSKDICRLILERISCYGGHYQFGTTKVGISHLFLNFVIISFSSSLKIFLKESLEQSLERERNQIMVSSVVRIQSHIRGYLARRRYQSYRFRVIKVQSLIRGHKVRNDYKRVRKSVIKIQANFRMKKQRLEYQKVCNI